MKPNEVRNLIRIAQKNKVTALDLSSRILARLPAEISELKNLWEFYISHNRLTSLPAEISELKNLRKFDISHNELTSLPPEISKLKNLRKLYIYDNRLTSLPPEISELKNLTELDISRNQLTWLPAEISELKNLTEFDISINQLTLLPPEISELKNLTKFDLFRNQLTSLPPEIKELKNLMKFYISRNRLTSLPSEISELKDLRKLDISHNELTSLPPEISELKNLTELYIFDNQLTSLPPEISKLKNLRKLYIYDNRLTSLPPEISELKNLTELDISRNQLTWLPAEISKLKNLRKLYIFDNQLTSLPPEIKELKNLTEFDISRNQFTWLSPEISKLKNLTLLFISGNQLTSLPPEISKLKSLIKLDISHNQLTWLPPEILELGLEIKWNYELTDKGIFSKGNPLENPPIEILKQGMEAVFNYFKSLEDGKEPLNEVKVLLVGEGDVGKTSLVKRIFGEEIDGNEPQTQGINIRKLIINNEGREIRANFWDFGGQQIMHATHQFFLSKRSLYILVLDGRKEENSEYWLKLIENFGGDSPVLVVINKIDQNPAYELNRKFLQEKYPSIRGFYRLSCKSNEGFKEFSKTLQDELTKVKHLEIKWPKSWFNVKNKLEKMNPNYFSIEDDDDCEHSNFIEYNEYKAMCYEEDIRTESEQNTLVSFLNDLGIILHFKDIPLLNTYVLEPEWVTNAVYRIVTSKKIANFRGILKPDDMLPEILKQNIENKFYYPPDQYVFIISLMKKFELSYDLDEQTVLIPSLLEIQEPNFEFDYKVALKFIIDYDFLPLSVIPRFIVKMNGYIKDNLRWRTGAVLIDENLNSSAVVRADNEAKRINIYVNGDQRRDYFAIILQKFREINTSFEKLKATEKIPLPDKPEVTVGYEYLIKLEARGIEVQMFDGSDSEYRVSDLLGTVINRRSEMALLEEIFQMTEVNRSSEKDILEILSTLQKIDSKSVNDETFLEKVTNVFSVQPKFFGIGVNINEIARLYLRRRRRLS
jgi:small GTP-binding protein domain